MNKIFKFFNINNIHQKGYLGQNITIAILDTGIYPHIDLIYPNNKILKFKDFVNNKNHPYDDNGHGTHVGGIICGSGYASHGLYKGIAPHSNIISIKVLDKYGNGNILNMIKGILWSIQNMNKYNIRILNLSVGTIPKNTIQEKLLISYVEYAWDMGLVVLTASGNSGPMPMSITIPGTSKKVITVGCSEDVLISHTNKSFKTSYSGCGPTSECIVKPEIVAPGLNITSCFPSKNKYISKSGSSMSTPIVSGSIALLLSKYPNYTNKEVKIKLKNSSTNINKHKNKQGWGLININKLLDI